MPLWALGNAYMVATSHGIGRVDGKLEKVHRFSREGLRRDQDPPKLELFTVLDSNGTRAAVRREREPGMLWTSADASLVPLTGPELLEAAPTSNDGTLVAAIAEAATAKGGDSRDLIVLSRVRIDGKVVVPGNRVSLPPSVRVRWPSALWKSGKESWPEEDPDPDEDEPFRPEALGVRHSTGAWIGRVRLNANRCGIAVTSTYSGVVAILDPKTLESRLCVRVPTEQSQFDLFALPVPLGVLVTLVADYRHTEYVLIGWNGEVLAHRDRIGDDLAWGAFSPGVLWTDSRVLVNQDSTDSRAYWLSLPSLRPAAFAGQEEDERLAIDTGTSADGSSHLVAFAESGYRRPENWSLLRYEIPKTKAGAKAKTSAKLKGIELTVPDFRPPVTSAPAVSNVPRVDGPPTLAAVADPSTVWRGAVGQEMEFAVRVINRGGPLRGLYVEIGDVAVSGKLLAMTGAGPLAAGQIRVVPGASAVRVELPDVPMEAGFVDPKGAPAGGEPTFLLAVRVRGERAGSGLLTVRVGPLQTKGTAGSALLGRGFVVDP